MIKKIVLLVLCSTSVYATTLYVDLNSPSPTPPYTNWGTAATNIQDAVDAAVHGDTVVVTNGHYYLSSEITIAKNITVQSVNGPTDTIVDGLWSVTCFQCPYGGGSQSVLSGFSIINGFGRDGGGVYSYYPSTEITNCIISGCFAEQNGGGVYKGTVRNSIITDNMSLFGSGGGMYYGYAYDCIITSNTCDNAGAGVCTGLEIQNCVIAGNRSGSDGGGMYGSSAISCVVRDNSAGDSGGGCSASSVFNCLIVNNRSELDGGGLYEGAASSCTVVGNFAGGEGAGTQETGLYNSIIYYNHGLNANFGTTAFCCAPELTSGLNGNISVTPLFVDNTNNFRLATGSPCIDVGLNGYASQPTDLDGNARIVNLRADIGAYEYQDIFSSSDDDGDGLTNGEEVSIGTNTQSPDSDGDGFDDFTEIERGWNPLVPDEWIVPYITNNPTSFDLPLSGGVIDVAVGQMLLSTTNGEARLSIQLEQSEDLVIWTNASDAVEWILPVDATKQFFRVRSGPTNAP